MKKSNISGGGYRTTERVGRSVVTNDYGSCGRRHGSTLTDGNGNIWSRDRSNRTTRIIGNDGRNKR